MKNFILRAISGAAYVALIVASILLLDNSPVMFLIVFCLFAALGINEMLRMDGQQDTESWLVMAIDMLGGAGLVVAFHLLNDDSVRNGLWLLPIAGYMVVRFIVQLYRPRQNALHSLERSLFTVGYVALPIALLNSIIAITAPRILLAVFIFIWINDTGAFLVGITLGRHRLFERISPKKSWEGFFGGLAACVAAAFVFDKWCNEFFQVPEIATWIGLSIVVCLAATMGDLVESLIKRTVGVKDSGKLIPGHGGVLDRIDSLLLVSPAVLIYLILMVYNN
ncbi:MAG: phosphatidate cytidylyltransferase [Muribaculaceae bacterium]|nr:phosphatidate cytidylyltransferase [Muribaculaceae bacterium]